MNDSNDYGNHSTTPLSTEQALHKAAKRRVEQKMGFYTHALVYVLVNLGLFLLNNMGDWNNGMFEHHRWHFIPMIPWGIGLAIHGVVTFFSLQGGDLRQHMMDKELETLRRRQQR
ncbi:2TM domain-containing protein [Pelomonas sp. V22]|uniref:2TM domain-containing protein n=1 Tax=Pelomonas sp. V22 TaxID=2822139 RepID=UPI0024A8A72D|nr:2TM domain-containing protein [Pelomonas sp. V22]MDI4632211.1 2TM domain-containing protein [Pelomonas sp. V22]